MWTRGELKDRAKNVLRRYYWVGLAVSILSGIFNGWGSSGARFYNFNLKNFNSENFSANNFESYNYQDYFNFQDYFDINSFAYILGFLFAAFLFVAVISLGIFFFVGSVFEVGKCKYYIEASKYDSKFTNIAFGFKGGNYLNVVKAMAWRFLFNYLWYLLLFIPGIVKSLAYSMVPYILADNPNIGYRRALKLSMAMTEGEKWNIFVLYLSFLGWIILGFCLCCIGVLFLTPYIDATIAELYTTLKNKALMSGLCTDEELGETLKTTLY